MGSVFKGCSKLHSINVNNLTLNTVANATAAALINTGTSATTTTVIGAAATAAAAQCTAATAATASASNTAANTCDDVVMRIQSFRVQPTYAVPRFIMKLKTGMPFDRPLNLIAIVYFMYVEIYGGQ